MTNPIPAPIPNPQSPTPDPPVRANRACLSHDTEPNQSSLQLDQLMAIHALPTTYWTKLPSPGGYLSSRVYCGARTPLRAAFTLV
jgi:hypothetical protein